MVNKIKIILVENSSILIEGVSQTLLQIGNADLVRTVPDCKKALAFISPTGSPIVLLDTRLAGLELPQFIQDCREKNPDVSIIGLHTNFISSQLLSLFDEIIHIEDNFTSIRTKIEGVNQTENNKDGNDNCDLSSREKDVLIAVAKGKTNKEIADELNISIHTVMTHRKNITGKTGIKSISGLTVYALLNNLIKQEDVN